MDGYNYVTKVEKLDNYAEFSAEPKYHKGNIYTRIKWKWQGGKYVLRNTKTGI